jgi:hypothetical protein
MAYFWWSRSRKGLNLVATEVQVWVARWGVEELACCQAYRLPPHTHTAYSWQRGMGNLPCCRSCSMPYLSQPHKRKWQHVTQKNEYVRWSLVTSYGKLRGSSHLPTPTQSRSLYENRPLFTWVQLAMRLWTPTIKVGVFPSKHLQGNFAKRANEVKKKKITGLLKNSVLLKPTPSATPMPSAPMPSLDPLLSLQQHRSPGGS